MLRLVPRAATHRSPDPPNLPIYNGSVKLILTSCQSTLQAEKCSERIAQQKPSQSIAQQQARLDFKSCFCPGYTLQWSKSELSWGSKMISYEAHESRLSSVS